MKTLTPLGLTPLGLTPLGLTLARPMSTTAPTPNEPPPLEELGRAGSSAHPTQSPSSASVALHRALSDRLSDSMSGRGARAQIALAEDCRGAIVVEKPFHTDFIGPGAAILYRWDVAGMRLHPVGNVRFKPLQNSEERRRALETRIEYLSALAAIARSPVALRRSCQVVQQLCQWVPRTVVEEIPVELVAQLVGAPVLAIKMAWRTYGQLQSQPQVNPWTAFALGQDGDDEFETAELSDVGGVLQFLRDQTSSFGSEPDSSPH